LRLTKIIFTLIATLGLGFSSDIMANAQTTYYGSIDLGSKGIKSALYSFVKEAEGRNARVLYDKTVNTALVSGMKGTQFTPDGIHDAADTVKQLMEDMRAEAKKRKLASVEYYVVGSSGVAKAENKDDLAAAVKTASGFEMSFVDAKQEAYFGARSSIPKVQLGKSMLVDIGSGNTKLGCLVGASDFYSREIPFGSVTGRNAGEKKSPQDIPAGIDSVMLEEVSPAYKKESMNVPCLANRQRIYWIGGAAWATATFMHPERALSGYVVIYKRDVDTFLSRLKDGTWNQKPLTFSFAGDVTKEQQAAIRLKAELERSGPKGVMNVFVREDLLSGVSIMKTVLAASNPSAVVVFSRNGNYIYGYALDKYKADRDAESAGVRPSNSTVQAAKSSRPAAAPAAYRASR
jgi:hypothetical protein